MPCISSPGWNQYGVRPEKRSVFYCNAKALNQGCVAPRLKSSPQKLYIVITIWLTITKYPYLKWQWIFSFLCNFVLFPLSPIIFFIGFDYTCIYIYCTLRFYFPYLSLLAQPVNITLYGPGLDCLIFDSVPERYLHYYFR